MFVCFHVVCKGTNEPIKGNVMSTSSVSGTTTDFDVMWCMRFISKSYRSFVSCQFDSAFQLGAWDIKVAGSQNDLVC